FVRFKTPSMKSEQFSTVPRLSVAVKLKFTVVLELLKPLAGEFRVTTGGVVSTVNVLVTLAPVLLALSLQLTFQLCVPWAIADTDIVVAVLLSDELLLPEEMPSMNRVQFIAVAWLSAGV